MDILSNIKDDTIIVTSYEYKKFLLQKIDESGIFINIKFFDIKEFINKYFFTYDENAIYYLMDKYGVSFDVACIYLDNLYYVDDKVYNNDKLDKLVNIKNDLITKNLLIFDDLFLSYVSDKDIIFYNYNYFSKLELYMIDELKKICNVSIISKEYANYRHDVYEFDSIFSEVSFVCTSILKLIESGVSPSLIKLTNVNDDYLPVISFMFPMFGLKIDVNNNYLISNSIVKEFLDMDLPISDAIDILCEKYKDSLVLKKIISIVSKYIIFSDPVIVKEMIINEFKRTKIDSISYDNAIEIIDYKNCSDSSCYVFMLGFNQNSIPVVFKDEDYITDDLKDGLFLDTTLEKNKLEKACTINNIRNIKNLVISYKKSSPFGVFYPSNLIGDMNLSVITDFKFDEIYSLDYASIMLAREYDNYILYGSVTDDLCNYNSSISIPYNTYDNKFKQIESSKFLSFVKDGFNLSYSSMNDYYKCGFKYYLSNVLKLNIFEDNFITYIGNLFHYVLEKGLLSLKGVDDLVSEFIDLDPRVLSPKEKVLVSNIISEISFALDTIKENLKKTDLSNILFERKVEIIKNDKVTVIFKGFIDKIMYDKFDNDVIAVIVDYKTGLTDINLKYVPFGLSMQLPVYLYLAKNIGELGDVKFGGFYLQRVLHSKPVISLKSDYEKDRKDNLLLYGYSNSDKNILKRVDRTYVDSSVIKSMKLAKNGEFSRYSKVLNNCQIDKLISLVDDKINDAISMICDAKFDINPKVLEDKNLGCLYCKYKDICFVKKSDEVLINPSDDLDFLGGDFDA